MKTTLILTLFISFLYGASAALQFKKRKPSKNSIVEAGERLFRVRVKLFKNEIALGKTVETIQFQLRDPSGALGSWVSASTINWNGKNRNFNSRATMTIGNTAGQWDWRITAVDSDGSSKTSGWFGMTVLESTGETDPPTAAPTKSAMTAAPTRSAVTTAPTPTPDTSLADIQAAMNAILPIARAANGRLRPKFVRLGFHDCVGGCDGCINLDNADNLGLEEPIDALAPVIAVHTSEGGLTRADIWAMAAMVSAEDAQPNNNAQQDYNFEWYGRSTCDAIDGKGGPDRELPSADLDTHQLLAFFFDEFGLDGRETVALMGAHSIGTLTRANSGFDGANGWTGNNRVLDNRYYSELIGGNRNVFTDNMDTLLNAPNWNQVLITNPEANIPDRFQWNRGGGGGGGGTPPMMTNSDMALCRDFTSRDNDFDAGTGEVNCRFRANRNDSCPHATLTWDHMKEFKFDNDAFLEAFRDVFMKVLHHGSNLVVNGVVKECSSAPCVIV